MTTFKEPPAKQSAAADGDDDPGAADFAMRARTVLLESVDNLDGRARSRLAQARHAALAPLEGGRAYPLLGARWLAPAGGLVAAAVVAVAWLGVTRLDPSVQSAGVSDVSAGSPLDDMEIMAGAENLELIEDLEFYAWLDAEAALPMPAGEAG